MFLWGAVGAAIDRLARQRGAPEPAAARRRDRLRRGDLGADRRGAREGSGAARRVRASRWAHRRFGVFEFDGVTDGIVYGAAIGIGFAFTEDLYYFFREARESGVDDAISVFVDRRDFFGPAMLRHAIWTATFGAGLGLATHARHWWGKVGWPLLGLAAAMLMHAVNNGLVDILLAIEYGFETTYDYLASASPPTSPQQMAADGGRCDRRAALRSRGPTWSCSSPRSRLWLLYQRRVIGEELAGECERGDLTADEAALAESPLARMRAEFAALRAGDLDEAKRTSALCRELAELAFAKRRIGGDESGGAELRTGAASSDGCASTAPRAWICLRFGTGHGPGSPPS